MILLAIDTSANLCAACVYDATAGRELGRSAIDIGKGHAERLMGVIEEALRAADAAYTDLGGIAVSVGPGSFTGIRVGVATARGLALALKIPSVGVGTLESLAEEARSRHPGAPVLSAIDGGRGEIYVAFFKGDGRLASEPHATTVAEAAALVPDGEIVLAGSAAHHIAAALPHRRFAFGPELATADIATYARLAAGKGFTGGKPKPAYLRAPDAKPQASFVLPRR